MRLPPPLAFTFTLVFAVVALALPAHAADPFPRVPSLEPNVSFWKRVYAVWSMNEIAFHDTETFAVYRVVKVPPRGKTVNGVSRRDAVRTAREELETALAALEKKQPSSSEGLSGVEKEVFESLATVTSADKYRRTSTLRAQNGLREKFLEGWRDYGRYADQIEARLMAAGLPKEIVALAFVESLIQIRARSHAGATGVWQFMRPTAREYMQVHHVLDERYDPLIATDAAAKYLTTARRTVGPWPVAITSYNYGRAGMRKAINADGSDDLDRIYKEYKYGRFGFAAKNYYASFRAVLDVLAAPEIYLKGVRQLSPWRYDVVRLPFPVLASQLTDSGAISAKDLESYNPALTRDARRGKELLPRGLPLRVPRGQGQSFLQTVLSMSDVERYRALDHVRSWHRAKGRRSLSRIARLYGVDVDVLAARNGLSKRGKVPRGTKVAIPSSPVRYTLYAEAKHLPIPDAPVLAARDAPPIVASAQKPARASQRAVARVDGPPPPTVNVVGLKTVRLRSRDLGAVDVLTGAAVELPGEVDIITGEAGFEMLPPITLPPKASPNS